MRSCQCEVDQFTFPCSHIYSSPSISPAWPDILTPSISLSAGHLRSAIMSTRFYNIRPGRLWQLQVRSNGEVSFLPRFLPQCASSLQTLYLKILLSSPDMKPILEMLPGLEHLYIHLASIHVIRALKCTNLAPGQVLLPRLEELGLFHPGYDSAIE
ncbi:hypothetical protein PM082_004780 [Marasmius tenuissimus]|nr:hypothetical protein PM082_004780 [Marasmius tenuissimus]